MGKPRGVDPGVTRCPLPGDDWVDVRNQLTAGDRDDAYAASYETTFSVADGFQTVLNRRTFLFAQVAVYVEAWSFADAQGAALPWPAMPVEAGKARAGALAARIGVLRERLNDEDWDELRAVVDAHVSVREADRAAKKKTLTGAPTGESSSSSADSCGGPGSS